MCSYTAPIRDLHVGSLYSVDFTLISPLDLSPLKGHFLSQHVYPMICISGTQNCCSLIHPLVFSLVLLGSVFFPVSAHSTEQSPWAANNHSASQYIPCILLNPKLHYNFHKSLTLVSFPVSSVSSLQKNTGHAQTAHHTPNLMQYKEPHELNWDFHNTSTCCFRPIFLYSYIR